MNRTGVDSAFDKPGHTLFKGKKAVAKKQMGRPKTSERVDVTIKFDKILANKARQVALARNVSFVEYLSELARPLIDKDYAKLLRDIEGEGK